jgi:hypothetical protein
LYSPSSARRAAFVGRVRTPASFSHHASLFNLPSSPQRTVTSSGAPE